MIGTEVHKGQVWADLHPRTAHRRITVEDVTAVNSRVLVVVRVHNTGRSSRIRLDIFTAWYRLLSEPETPEVSA